MRLLLILLIAPVVAFAAPPYKVKIGFRGFEGRSFSVPGEEDVEVSDLLNQQFVEEINGHSSFLLVSKFENKCLAHQPQFLMDGFILGYEFKSTERLRFGFTCR